MTSINGIKMALLGFLNASAWFCSANSNYTLLSFKKSDFSLRSLRLCVTRLFSGAAYVTQSRKDRKE